MTAVTVTILLLPRLQIQKKIIAVRAF